MYLVCNKIRVTRNLETHPYFVPLGLSGPRQVVPIVCISAYSGMRTIENCRYFIKWAKLLKVTLKLMSFHLPEGRFITQ